MANPETQLVDWMNRGNVPEWVTRKVELHPSRPVVIEPRREVGPGVCVLDHHVRTQGEEITTEGNWTTAFFMAVWLRAVARLGPVVNVKVPHPDRDALLASAVVKSELPGKQLLKAATQLVREEFLVTTERERPGPAEPKVGFETETYGNGNGGPPILVVNWHASKRPQDSESLLAHIAHMADKTGLDKLTNGGVVFWRAMPEKPRNKKSAHAFMGVVGCCLGEATRLHPQTEEAMRLHQQLAAKLSNLGLPVLPASRNGLFCINAKQVPPLEGMSRFDSVPVYWWSAIEYMGYYRTG